MRVVLAVAAGLLWVSAAYAQPAHDTTTQTPSAGSASEPSAQQAQSPTAEAAPTQTAASQVTDPNQQIICHTMMNAGSRLSRHATRVCKTRQQWEIEADQNQRDMQQNAQQRTPMPTN
ncbi:MAG: hypothetical protein WAU68_09570 [Vitreimonas sp.]